MAKDFSIQATSLHDNDIKYEKRVFLSDAIKHNHMDELTSPFNKNEKCDKYESKVIFDDNNNKKVTIKCSKYLIFNESGFGKVEDYTIYEVSKWTDEELIGGDFQTATFYNYSVDGNIILDRFMPEKEFLEAYSMKSGNNILSLSQVDSDKFKVETKLYYRTIKEVN